MVIMSLMIRLTFSIISCRRSPRVLAIVVGHVVRRVQRLVRFPVVGVGVAVALGAFRSLISSSAHKPLELRHALGPAVPVHASPFFAASVRSRRCSTA